MRVASWSHADFQSGMQIGLVSSKDVRTERKLQRRPDNCRCNEIATINAEKRLVFTNACLVRL